ncbi:MAG: hypothetical protein COA78_12060 [Blastopirellula sp.]|nr:MAG: hypothetical protein COA78_12060 [Blastopirellula sp.]
MIDFTCSMCKQNHSNEGSCPLYLIVEEDGSISKVHSLASENHVEADNGLVQIIDVSMSNNPLIYSLQGWTDIDFREVRR